MRALRFHRFGPPEVLVVDDVPEPVPGTGEALIEVHAVGLNFADTERRRGVYLADAPLPATSGFEGAGVVRACASTPALIGRRVAFLGAGAAAEACVARLDRLVPLPGGVDFVSGAALLLQGLTAWHVLHTAGRVQAGETVCISAAAGGVGLLATQLARQAGAHVIGVVSSKEKEARVRARGAHEVLVGFDAGALESRVDVFLDSIGRDAAEFGWQVLRPFGRWVHFGEASGPSPALEPGWLLEKSLSVQGWWLRTPHPEGVWAAGVEGVLEHLGKGTLSLDVTSMPLAEAARAHALLEQRQVVGKVVLVVREPERR
ncbi:MAG: zinc-binding dehydrogenase [Myxococcaceae bacterium]|nr:zinc-binding dehydrogenase [Myxococcaceae bacterium]